MKYLAQLSLEELWARTLQEIDFLHDDAQRNEAEMSATDLNTLSKALSTLRKHGPLPTKTLPADPQLATVRSYFAEHGTALCNAAALVGGDAGTARVLRLMSELRMATRLDRTTRCRLVDLHRLLSLDPVIEDFEPDLSTWFLLDPASREVEQLCLLTDQLYDLLIVIGELDEGQDALALALRARTAA